MNFEPSTLFIVSETTRLKNSRLINFPFVLPNRPLSNQNHTTTYSVPNPATFSVDLPFAVDPSRQPLFLTPFHPISPFLTPTLPVGRTSTNWNCAGTTSP